MKTKKLTRLSIYIAIAIVLNIIEKIMPMSFIVPGAKLGLANIVTIYAILKLSYKDTFMILLARIFLGSIFGGGLSGLLYSFSGGLLSFVFMIIIKEIFKENVSAIGISVTGAVFHNIGQIIVAIIILGNIKVISYLPVLIFMGIISGIFIGYVGNYFNNHLSKIKV